MITAQLFGGPCDGDTVQLTDVATHVSKPVAGMDRQGPSMRQAVYSLRASTKFATSPTYEWHGYAAEDAGA